MISRRKLIVGAAAMAAYQSLPSAAQVLAPSGNRLAFPAGMKPRFDPSHPAARGFVRFSGVPTGLDGGYVNILNGAVGVKTATPPTTVMSQIGPVLRTGFSGAIWSAFAGQPSVTDNTWTMACMLLGERSAGSGDILMGITGGIAGSSPAAVGLNSLQPVVYRAGFGNSVVISTTLNQNEWYFLAASGGSTGSCYMVAVSLKTGQLFTGTGAFTNTNSSNGTYTVGGSPVTAGGFNAQYGPTMFSTARLGLAELVNWSADPWSFWYDPNEPDYLVGLLAGGGSSLPLMGIGN